MLYCAGKQAKTKTRACKTGTERFLHWLKKELPKTAALTTSEPHSEIRNAGSSRYRGYERQFLRSCKQGGTVEYIGIVSHP